MVKLILDGTAASRDCAEHLQKKIFPAHEIVLHAESKPHVLALNDSGAKLLCDLSGDRSVPLVILVRCESDGSVSKAVRKLTKALQPPGSKNETTDLTGQFVHLILLGGATCANSAVMTESEVFEGGMRLKQRLLACGAELGSDVVKIQSELEDISVALEGWIVSWETANKALPGDGCAEGGDGSAHSDALSRRSRNSPTRGSKVPVVAPASGSSAHTTSEVASVVAQDELPLPLPAGSTIIVLHSGDLAEDIGARIVADFKSRGVSRCALQPMTKFKTALALTPGVSSSGSSSSSTSSSLGGARFRVVIFVLQTIENGAAPETAEPCLRFLKRKTHPRGPKKGFLSSAPAPDSTPTAFVGKRRTNFAVLGLGDSNLLLDRQTTGAADCNQAAQLLDGRLEELGARRILERGEADERTGLERAVEPWCRLLMDRLAGPTTDHGGGGASGGGASGGGTSGGGSSGGGASGGGGSGGGESKTSRGSRGPDDADASKDGGAHLYDDTKAEPPRLPPSPPKVPRAPFPATISAAANRGGEIGSDKSQAQAPTGGAKSGNEGRNGAGETGSSTGYSVQPPAPKSLSAHTAAVNGAMEDDAVSGEREGGEGGTKGPPWYVYAAAVAILTAAVTAATVYGRRRRRP